MDVVPEDHTTLPSDVGTCAICDEPLLVPDTDSPKSTTTFFLDDVELNCHHHFRWSCFADYDREAPTNRSSCPACGSPTLSSSGLLIVTIRNEGGVTENFNLGAELDEEAFYDAHPQLKCARAFLGLMAQREFDAAAELLHSGDDGTEEISVDCRLSDGGQTALHMAALNDDVEACILLLNWGASPDLQDEQGKTALAYAMEHGADAAASVLKEHE